MPFLISFSQAVHAAFERSRTPTSYTPNAVTFPQLKPDTAQFDGVLTTPDRIDGTLIRFGTPQSFSLLRFLNDPP